MRFLKLYKTNPIAMAVGTFFISVILIALAIKLLPLFLVLVGIGVIGLLCIRPSRLKHLHRRYKNYRRAEDNAADSILND